VQCLHQSPAGFASSAIANALQQAVQVPHLPAIISSYVGPDLITAGGERQA
jgi:hypothetical protein